MNTVIDILTNRIINIICRLYWNLLIVRSSSFFSQANDHEKFAIFYRPVTRARCTKAPDHWPRYLHASTRSPVARHARQHPITGRETCTPTPDHHLAFITAGIRLLFFSHKVYIITATSYSSRVTVFKSTAFRRQFFQ